MPVLIEKVLFPLPNHTKKLHVEVLIALRQLQETCWLLISEQLELANVWVAFAEAVYRRDLEDHPHNGWALFGLIQALDAQGKTEAAEEARKHFETVWQFADVTLSASII